MAEQKRLTKSNTDKMVCGVSGGVARYLNIDPVLVRLAFVLSTLLWPPSGLVLYIALCLIMPEEGGRLTREMPEARTETSAESDFEPLGTRGE